MFAAGRWDRRTWHSFRIRRACGMRLQTESVRESPNFVRRDQQPNGKRWRNGSQKERLHRDEGKPFGREWSRRWSAVGSGSKQDYVPCLPGRV